MYSAYGAAPQTLPTHYQGGRPLSEAYEQEQMPLSMPRKGVLLGQRRSFSIVGMVQSFLLPVLVFIVMLSIHTFKLRYYSFVGTIALEILCFAIVAYPLALAWMAWKRRQSNGLQEPAWLAYSTAACLVAFIVGIFMGQHIFNVYTRSFYDLEGLNEYTGVDPSVSRGQMFMDAGRLHFTNGSRLEVSKSMGFRNDDTYCVAPVVGNTSASTYEFWAIGMNCCSPTGGDFHCGEYANTRVMSGMRVVQNPNKEHFRLAVQQAEAAYNIHVGYPIFLHWVESPSQKMHELYHNGVRYYALFIITWVAWQIVATILAVYAIAKL